MSLRFSFLVRHTYPDFFQMSHIPRTDHQNRYFDPQLLPSIVKKSKKRRENNTMIVVIPEIGSPYELFSSHAKPIIKFTRYKDARLFLLIKNCFR